MSPGEVCSRYAPRTLRASPCGDTVGKTASSFSTSRPTRSRDLCVALLPIRPIRNVGWWIPAGTAIRRAAGVLSSAVRLRAMVEPMLRALLVVSICRPGGLVVLPGATEDSLCCPAETAESDVTSGRSLAPAPGFAPDWLFKRCDRTSTRRPSDAGRGSTQAGAATSCRRQTSVRLTGGRSRAYRIHVISPIIGLAISLAFILSGIWLLISGLCRRSSAWRSSLRRARSPRPDSCLWRPVPLRSSPCDVAKLVWSAEFLSGHQPSNGSFLSSLRRVRNPSNFEPVPADSPPARK